MEQPQQDPSFSEQVQKLHRLTVYSRWFVVGLLWLTIAPVALWDLRSEIELWRQYFTWSAVRYALFFHPLATLSLSFCLGMMMAVLIWQSRNILFGLPKSDRERLEKQVYQIRQQGSTHPLWKWIQ